MEVASIRRHNQTVLNSLEEGDLVEFPRAKGIFFHWAVYIGNGDVVHLTGDVDESSVTDASSHVSSSGVFVIGGELFEKATVKREKFFVVAADSKAKKNNDTDNTFRPFDKGTIVQRALSKLDETGYNILWRNCEHFANWCRNGYDWSEQAIAVLSTFQVALIVAVTLVIAIVLQAAYGIFNSENEKN